jgi:gas vesicle protein
MIWRRKIMSKKGYGKLLFGLGVGAGLGLLFAPKTGIEIRKDLKKKLDELYAKVKDIDKEEVKKTIVKKIDDIKKELSDLDKEKVTQIAKKQATNIQKKAEDLYKYAVEKGTPILQNAVDEVRNQAIKLTKEITKKLEASKKESKKEA